MTISVIPVTILTGFLGAGKTTVLNTLLRDPAFAETAVLINEFGDVQVDHDLVVEFSDELIMTTTGCLCCTASSDIKQSLFELWRKRKDREIGPFKRVIVETTGLMDPVPVITSLLAPPTANMIDRIVSQQFALSKVITLFDIINGPMTLDSHPEALQQVALADVIVLTKTDLAQDPATQRDILVDRNRLNIINAGADILDRQTDWPSIRSHILATNTYDLRTKGEDAQAWLAEGKFSAGHGHHHKHSHGHSHDHHDNHDHNHAHHHHHDHSHTDTNRHGDDIFSHVIVLDEPVSPLVFHMFLETLRLAAGTDLLRLKALFALTDDPDRPVVVHGVQHLIHPIDKLERWPSDDRRTKIVMIGRNLKIDTFRDVLGAESAGPPMTDAEENVTA